MKPDVYPLPNMLDFAAKAARCTVFSKIDLQKGYHQIPVNPEDVQKNTITTPFDLFDTGRSVCLGGGGFRSGISWSQNFSGQRADTPFPRGRHTGASPPHHHQRATGLLGMVNFYRRFLPSIAHMLRPLMEELCGGKKRPDKLEWSAAMDAAFAGAKQALLSATHLVHRTVGAELSVVVDALATHEGTCLQQQLPGKKVWQPPGFFSKKLGWPPVRHFH